MNQERWNEVKQAFLDEDIAYILGKAPQPLAPRSLATITLGDIAYEVCQEYGLTKQALRSRRRDAKHSAARRAFSCLAAELTQKTPGQIAKFIERDRTTVVHHAKGAGKMLHDALAFQTTVNRIREALT